MSEKRYRFTTQNKQFESDNIGLDYLKEEDGVFYARENKSSDWSQLETLEKKTSSYEWWDKNCENVGVWSYFLCLGILLICVFITKSKWLIYPFVMCAIPPFYMLLCLLFGYMIRKILKQQPSYFVPLSHNKITELIEDEKRLSALKIIYNTKTGSGSYYEYNPSGYRGSSGGSGSTSGRTGSGGSAGSYSGSTYISTKQLDDALKDFETKGISWDDFVNHKTEREREQIFIDHFGDQEKGIKANEKFNKEDVWPSRKAHLKKLIEDGDYENESDKQQLVDKLKDWGEEITNESFQKFAREIRSFTEKKRRKENHIKYEGRLSNKAIQSIKEYHGYVCMGCGLDPVAEYGENMKGILEAHHKKPWAEIEDEQSREVDAKDFFILCPNCHKMIHRLDSPNSLDKLKEILNQPQDEESDWWD